MDSFSTDSLLSFGHLTRFRDPSCNILPALQPALTRAPPSRPWHTGSDSDESSLFALVVEANCPQVKFGHNQPLQGGSAKPLYTDPAREYPSPPSSSSTSQNTIPLPEEPGEFASVYSTHLVGVLDSPPVLRRRDLPSQMPLTPPPTIPHPTLNLPDVDIDISFVDGRLGEEEAEFKDEEHSFSPSGSSQPSVQSDLPLSPLSLNWKPSCTQVLSMASSQDASDSEQPNALFSPCDVSHTPASHHLIPSHEPSSLLEVDASRSLFAPISSSRSPGRQYTIGQDPTPPTPTPPSVPPSTDNDDCLPPPLPRGTTCKLPDTEDDMKPQIISSSDSDVDMRDCTGDSASVQSENKLVSLPGAEPDDDLIPPIPNPNPSSNPFVPLITHDPHDVPPRPPSPEDFDFCLTSADMTDPELAKLFDLRKRSIAAAERAAKLMEAPPGEFDLFRLAEARKTQKRERDRSKEVGTLIRLKLGDGKCPQTQIPERDQQIRPRSRGAVGNVSQLVAQMVFRRSYAPRPFSKRKSVVAHRECVRSSLSYAVVHGESMSL